MEDNALRRNDVDWAAVRRHAFAQAAEAQSPADTYPAIQSAVSALGDGHSTFHHPGGAEDSAGNTPIRAQVRGRALTGRLGYLSLPGVSGPAAVLKQYVQEGRAAIAQADRPEACGWVVDLRWNHGGNMWPMLAVVGPVLGDGDVGAFVDARGRRFVWSVQGGRPHLDGAAMGWSASASVGTGTETGITPVAVLVSRSTASSGEALTVAFRGRPATRSFGEDTAGVPTGNQPHRLSDGAVLNLTVFEDADRTGRTYDGPIPPDEVVVHHLGRDGKHDPVLEAATTWLSKQPACA